MYVNQEQPTTEVGIRSSTREDLYVILESVDPETGIASIALIVNPGMFWIWVGALIVLGGGVIVGWPSRRPAPALVTEEVSDEPRRVPVGVAG
jgi:cytochrome c-type biogenesis protein CcmF